MSKLVIDYDKTAMENQIKATRDTANDFMDKSRQFAQMAADRSLKANELQSQLDAMIAAEKKSRE